MEASRDVTNQAYRAGVKSGAARTVAQTGALVIGASLLAAGILGFFFGGSDFDTGGTVQGEEFIIFEVNGWHNVVHIATGAFLVLMAATARTAITGLIVFGAVYVVVTVWGFVADNDILDFLPVNTADNWLHLVLAAAALLIAFMAGGLGAASRRDRRGVRSATD